MALRTLGQRTFAALTFGAMTLHGIASEAVDDVLGAAARRKRVNDDAEIIDLVTMLVPFLLENQRSHHGN